VVAGAGALRRAEEVAARDLSGKMRKAWDREVQAVRLSKSSMTSPKRTFR